MTWLPDPERHRFGEGWIRYVGAAMEVGVGRTVLCRATPYALAVRMIDDGTLARSFLKLNTDEGLAA